MNFPVKIEKIVWLGKGLVRLDSGQVAFLPQGFLPGEEILASVLTSKKGYVTLAATEILTPSPKRVEHPCLYSSVCGGCSFGITSAPYALNVKKDMLEEVLVKNLSKFGDIPSIIMHGADEPWSYRYRGQIHVLDMKPHFKQSSTNNFVEIRSCMLYAKCLSDSLVMFAKTFKDGRHTVVGNPKTGQVAKGRTPLRLDLPKFGDIVIPSDIFFQSNWKMNGKLIDLVMNETADFTKIVDLYSGFGNFALPLAKAGKTVLAVESDKKSVETGCSLAEENKLTNIRYIHADLLEEDIWDEIIKEKPEFAIIDPPRIGAKISEFLNKVSSLNKIIWVSCDAFNTCRDINSLLAAGWKLTKLNLVDMFPQTWHMEVLFILER